MFDSTQRSRFDVADLEREANTLLTQYAALLQRLKLPDAAAALPLVGQARASVSDAQTLQALTVAFRLLDMAEARAVAQARAQARAHGAEESGLWASVLRELRLGKLPDAAIQAALGRVRVEAVFTAHPTEARRVSALQRWAELMQSLGEATSEAGPSSAFLPQLELILRMGETRLRKPRLDDERALVIHTVTTVLAPALMRVYRDASVQLEGALALAPADVPTPQFATWVGGDRDGHPFVTADFTQRSLQAYREAALTLQLQALGRLTQLLAIPAQLASLPAPFRARFAELCAALGPEAKSLQTRNPDEPLRVYVELLRAHLQQQVSDQNAATDRLVDTCLADLALLSAALRALGASALAAHYVEATRALWRAFGLHLLRVDLRQNSQVHDAAIEALLRRRGAADCDFSRWPEDKRRACLEAELRRGDEACFAPVSEDDAATPVLAALQVFQQHHRRHGAAGLGWLIISMTRNVSDLLALLVLAREAGLVESTAAGRRCLLPIAPLFETEDDLAAAPATLTGWWRSLQSSGFTPGAASPSSGAPQQAVMLGYSDSNKDAGPCASLWSVYEAQQKLLAQAAEHGVQLCFFHGRGGSTSRGAGPTFRFLAALPEGGLEGGLRLTEQGETLFQKYGTVDSAAYNLELLMAGSLRQVAGAPAGVQPSAAAALSAALGQLSIHSAKAYRALWNEPGFLTFFRQATPIDVLEHSGIGSRPASRRGQATLDDLRAIPWVFAWAQARIALSSWYGVGAGLEAVEQQDPAAFQQLCQGALAWPPGRYLLSNVSVSVLAVDLEVFDLYLGLVADAALRERIGGKLKDEFGRTRRMLERIYGKPLTEARPRMHALLQLRAAALRRAHHYQVRLLSEWRAQGATDDAQLATLLATVNAIAAGLRSTG